MSLVALLKHVKEHDDHPFLLAVIREVIKQKLPMMEAAVWCIFESIRLDCRYRHMTETGVSDFVAKADRSPAVHVVYGEKMFGYLVFFGFIDSYGEYDCDEFVIDADYAAQMTREYIKRAEFD